MKIGSRSRTRMASVGALGLAAFLAAGHAMASHLGSSDPADVGKLSPLIPVGKDAIHGGLSWTHGSGPKLCYGMRPTEYPGTALVNISDPSKLGTPASLRPEFAARVYGFNFSTGPNGLDQSVSSRFVEDVKRDNFVCLDLTHPDAFRNLDPAHARFDVKALTPADAALNAAALSNAGHSKGLHYNVFCAGQVALSDGRWFFFGGHDGAGNNGIPGTNVFDPVSQTWAARPVPATKAAYLSDPTAPIYPNPLDVANTTPPHPTDMKYARWYPSGVRLPDGRVLILSGTHQDKSLGSGPGGPCTSPPATAACSKVRQVTPEICDPRSGRCKALENSRKKFVMYPNSYLVATRNGPRVAVTGEVQLPEPTFDRMGAYDPWSYNGNTYLFDYLGAERDPDQAPATRHWEFVDTASIDEGSGAQIWQLDAKGRAISQRVVLFGANRTIETIDYSDAKPKWTAHPNLLLEAVSQRDAVVRPDGKVVVIGGAARRPFGFSCPSDPRDWGASFHYQLFDPDAVGVTILPETTVPRHDHFIAFLDPQARVWAVGGNRTDLAHNSCELDKGVPVAQIYEPEYLFRGPRPEIEEAPKRIAYRERFEVELEDDHSSIKSVALMAFAPKTHNWDWGNKLVKLWFKQEEDELVVQAPAEPALAVQGYYMLFVVDAAGVPSEAKLVHLDAR